eukprot:gene29395-36607_t
MVAESTGVDHVEIFEHVEGSQMCEGLFKHYHLPDGRIVHCYHRPRTLVDEVDVMLDVPQRPMALQDLGEACLPSVLSIHMMVEKPSNLWAATTPPPIPTPEVLCPPRHTLPAIREHQCADGAAAHCGQHAVFRDLHCILRLDYTEPPPPPPPRSPSPDIFTINLKETVFANRVVECESRAFLDSHSVYEDIIKKEWVNAMKSYPLRRLVGINSPYVLKILRKFALPIHACLVYYACSRTLPVTDPDLELNDWIQWMMDAEVCNARKERGQDSAGKEMVTFESAQPYSPLFVQ